MPLVVLGPIFFLMVFDKLLYVWGSGEWGVGGGGQLMEPNIHCNNILANLVGSGCTVGLDREGG